MSPRATSRRLRAFALSFRGRTLFVVLAATALGLALTGAITFGLQGVAVSERADAEILDEIDDLQTIASGPDGRTFGSVDELLFEVMSSDVPSTRESFGAIIDGRLVYVPPAAERAIDIEDPVLVEHALALADPTRTQSAQLEDSRGSLVRIAVVPVTVPGDPSQGYMVIVNDIGYFYGQVWRNLWLYVAVSLLTLVLVAVVGHAVMSRLLKPLDRITELAGRAHTNDLRARAELTGNGDEIDRLGASFNAMMDRVEDGITEQRRFMSDLSHELRTPLTIIRGNLEVMDEDDPTDVVDTRTLTLSEVDRMNRMVEDLSLLAKAQRSDFIAPAPTSSAAIVTEVAAKAAGLGPQTIETATSTDREVVVDRQRIEQALLQLCKNAVTYTPADSTISISVMFTSQVHGRPGVGSAALFRVVDDGPGIAYEEQAHIFERFHRGSTSRNKDGSGLGLSIVQAIAEAHGGWAELQSVPGHGAAFTIVVPDGPPAPTAAPAVLPERP